MMKMVLMVMVVVAVVVIRGKYNKPQHISVALLKEAVNQESLS
jgi:hypothetical protein